jgi:hypothetical protein
VSVAVALTRTSEAGYRSLLKFPPAAFICSARGVIERQVVAVRAIAVPSTPLLDG